MKKEYIRLDHISKKFGEELVLRDLDAVLCQGEILGFLGPSGAGKTTTIKILTGQLRQTSGEAYILGINAKKMDETIYEQIGIVTDNSGTYDYLSVYKNMEYFAKILRVRRERIDELLKKVGLYEHRKKIVGKLSKGQKQRLVLARSILHNPKVLFLDEPTSGLDPTTADAIHTLLAELKEQGMAVFLTTHNMEEATKLCDHVALLNEGVIVEYGVPREICIKYNKKKTYHICLEDGGELDLEQSETSAEQIAAWMKEDRIQALHSSEPTLENVFLTVTGRNLR